MFDKLHVATREEYKKRKLLPFCMRMDFHSAIKWCETISEREFLKIEHIEKHMKEVIWGLNSLDLNIGYTLLSLKDTSYPSGHSGKASTTTKLERSFSLADIHHWYHISNTWESIYRIWERIVNLLKARFTPNLLKKLYFDGYSNFIHDEKVIFEKEAKELKKFNKAWNKIASIRNKISHGEFNPFIFNSLDLTDSSIDENGAFTAIANYKFPNLKEETQTAINYAEKTVELINFTVKICELRIGARKNITNASYGT